MRDTRFLQDAAEVTSRRRHKAPKKPYFLLTFDPRGARLSLPTSPAPMFLSSPLPVVFLSPPFGKKCFDSENREYY